MPVISVGLNHKTAPLEVREKVAFSKEEAREALQVLARSFDGVVILSTCNRTEVYAATHEPQRSIQSIAAFLSERAQEDLGEYLYKYSQEEAVPHLFRVAAGLDSMIVGEAQVLGQVRIAMSLSTEMNLMKGSLTEIFHRALRVGRRVRSETSLGERASSVSHAAVRLARHYVGDLKDSRVLVIGTGEAGKLAAMALKHAGVLNITVTNRTHSEAQELAEGLEGGVIPFQEMTKALAHFDIVLSSTGSPGFIVTTEMVAAALNGNGNSKMLFIDLAVPRDVDPGVAGLNGVSVLDVDDLKAVSNDDEVSLSRDIQQANAMVEEEVARFHSWLKELNTLPVVAALRQKAERVRKQEVARALRRLPNLSPEDAQLIDALSKAIVKKLLHDPTTALREPPDPGILQAAQRLFRLRQE